jgi:hypothetical protein
MMMLPKMVPSSPLSCSPLDPMAALSFVAVDAPRGKSILLLRLDDS